MCIIVKPLQLIKVESGKLKLVLFLYIYIYIKTRTELSFKITDLKGFFVWVLYIVKPLQVFL
jgi:hypothetical protein